MIRERYRIVGGIGEGGMGAVHLAEDERLPGRRCALKEVRLPAGLDEGQHERLREAFLAEAALLARLDHPALPKVSDHFEHEGRAWLVMDYVPGQDLQEVLTETLARRRSLDESQVRRWAEAVCDALSYLHGQRPPVIHRDIKPANLKLTPDGQVKLVDFGLARPADLPEGPTVTVLSGAGSRPYQPLEQYGDGHAVDARSDVYALGATLYHLVTGVAPPPAQDRFLSRRELEPPRALRPELSAELERALMAALALHPDQRPPGAEALRQLLGAPPVAGAPAAWPAALRANGWLLALVLMLFLAALALTLG